MSHYLCHDSPDVRRFSAEILACEPGRVLLSRSYFYPGGGGQLPDRGHITVHGRRLRVRGVEEIGGNWWHLYEGPDVLTGSADLEIDDEFRMQMSQLHTALHIVNSLVFREFAGALVTGAQMSEGRIARVDFDLPAGDNERIRALEPEINRVIAAGLPVRAVYLSPSALNDEPNVLRSKSVAPPPQPDGTLRVVDIEGLDRQACGGTHVAFTNEIPTVRIQKVESKGRQNRRVRIGLF